ncbi:RNA polymerase sigma factor [Sorangium sp. So ce136]|uniref:RNA polymerase sigma factor n=1 Tax=Sorangium sp. So ce136 TaxID=3133284 RepID=UPI003F07DD07
MRNLSTRRARATFAEGAEVVPWVYAIARNVHHGHARAARVRAVQPLLDVDVPDGGTDGESAVIAAEGAAVVARVLAGLPAPQREAFVLLRWEGLSVEQAAAVVGTTPTALKLRAFRAYEALRAALGVPDRRMAHAGGQGRSTLQMACQPA